MFMPRARRAGNECAIYHGKRRGGRPGDDSYCKELPGQARAVAGECCVSTLKTETDEQNEFSFK
jgi:hypothetical protein